MAADTVEDVLALLEQRPTDAELFQLLGRLLWKEGRLDEARVAYDQALTLDPGDPFTHLYLGFWFWTNGQRGEALKRFKHAAELLPEAAVVYWCQGDVYRAMGRPEAAAAAAYKKACRVEPEDKQARRKLFEWYEFRYGDKQG